MTQRGNGLGGVCVCVVYENDEIYVYEIITSPASWFEFLIYSLMQRRQHWLS